MLPSRGAVLSEEADAKVKSLQVLHAQKTRALMRSIEQLRKEVKTLQSQAKESRRSEMIQRLKLDVREQELVCDVLKKELGQSSGLSPAEVDDFVIKKTLGGPKRFRPKTREELTAEVRKLSAQLKKLKKSGKGEQREARKRGMGTLNEVATADVGKEPEVTASERRVKETSELHEELEEVKVELDAARKMQTSYKQRLVQLEEELASTNQLQDKVDKLGDKYAKAKALLQQQEQAEMEGERKVAVLEEENERLQGELQILKSQLAEKVRGLNKGEHDKIEVTRRASLREQELVKQIDQLKRDVASSKQEVFQRDKSVSEEQLRATSVLAERLAVLEQRAAASADANQSLRQQNSEYSEKIKELDNNRKRETESLNKELDESRACLKEAEERCERLQKEIEDSRGQGCEETHFQAAPQDEAFVESSSSSGTEEEEDEVEERVDELEDEIMQLKKKNEELYAQNERNAEYLEQLTKLKEKHEQAEKTESSSLAEVEEMQQALARVYAEKRAVDLALKKSKAYISRLELERSTATTTALTGRLKLLETQEVTLKAITEQLMGHVSLLLVKLEEHKIPTPKLPSLTELVASMKEVSTNAIVEERETSEFRHDTFGDQEVPESNAEDASESAVEPVSEKASTSESDNDSSDVEDLNSSEQSEDDDSRLYSLDDQPQERKM